MEIEEPRESYSENLRSGSFEVVKTTEATFGDSVDGAMETLRNGLGLPSDEFEGIEIPMREVLVNAIKHGNKYDPAKSVRVTYEATSHLITISVTDEGEGFEVENIPDPFSKEGLARGSGRGVLITRSMLDGFEVARHGTGCTVKLTKNRLPAKQ